MNIYKQYKPTGKNGEAVSAGVTLTSRSGCLRLTECEWRKLVQVVVSENAASPHDVAKQNEESE